MANMKMDAVDASLLVLNTMAGFLLVGIGTALGEPIVATVVYHR